MIRPPPRPRIYHITHVNNLPAIVAAGGLLSDARMIAQGGPKAPIGMSKIKRRRVEEIPVYCHPGTMVGDYVPFYFCPRSVMLYVIYRASDPELAYRGGQGEIVHLVSDMHEAVRWAEEHGKPWAFSLSNAGAYDVKLRDQLDQLNQIDWEAVAAIDWRAPRIRQAKQAEFLVHDFFPWELVTRIGVLANPVAQRVARALQGATHRPPVAVMRDWYY